MGKTTVTIGEGITEMFDRKADSQCPTKSNIEDAKFLNAIINHLEETSEDVTTIHSSKKVFMHISISLFQAIRHAIYLDLSNNKLDDLPSQMNLLEQLEHIDISYNEFTHIPNVVCQFQKLRVLRAQNNNLKELPKSIEDLMALKSLDVSSNELQGIPASCANLKHLQKLDLANNKLKIIPYCVSNGMSELRILDFSKNRKAELNIPPQSRNITAFYAKENGNCQSFPSWILDPKYFDLEVVRLDMTLFMNFDLPSNNTKSHIRILSITNSTLSDKIVENIVSRMITLESLFINNTVRNINARRLEGNSFWSLPVETARNPSNIREIDASATGIPHIPKTISNFAHLTCLCVSENRISWLPREICLLENLEILLLDSNELILLPDDIGNIKSLRELKLNFNRLSNLPGSMKDLQRLKFLDLYDNEFVNVPEIISELSLDGLDLERNYFSTNDSLILESLRYANMKSSLRKHWTKDTKLESNWKEPLRNFDSSDSEWIDEEKEREEADHKLNYFVPEDASASSGMQEQLWDLSEDSTDEFDPYEKKEPKVQHCSPLLTYQPKQYMFCPADSHEKQVRLRVRQMLQNGTLVWSSNYEPGQFDDP